MRFICLFIVFTSSQITAANNLWKNDKVTTVDLQGQFGNQLFQIATAYAYSLDHESFFSIPNLFTNKKWNIDENAKRLFRDKISDKSLPKKTKTWVEPSLRYSPIPDYERIRLSGYFQSEKYFKHRRQEIQKLFKIPPNLEKKILMKYPFLFSETKIVGVQIRDYRKEFPTGEYHPTCTRQYFEKAVTHFSLETIFIISTNNLKLAKECMEGLARNIVYLSSGDYIEDFYVLSLCRSFIISNSSFGWWAAWLSESADKVVIAPSPWLAPPYDNCQTQDIVPNEWLTIGM